MPDVAASILVAAKKQSQLTHGYKLLTNPGRLKRWQGSSLWFMLTYLLILISTLSIISTALLCLAVPCYALLFTSLRDCQMEKQHSTCSHTMSHVDVREHCRRVGVHYMFAHPKPPRTFMLGLQLWEELLFKDMSCCKDELYRFGIVHVRTCWNSFFVHMHVCCFVCCFWLKLSGEVSVHLFFEMVWADSPGHKSGNKLWASPSWGTPSFSRKTRKPQPS